MKKIALFLTFALALSSVLSAADVAWGGWVQVEGNLATSKSGDNASDIDKKTKTNTTVLDLGLDFTVTGDNFGFKTGLTQWSDSSAAGSDFEKDKLELKETFIYSNFNDYFRLYAGLEMETAIKYNPGSNDFFSDKLSSGMGSYNYQGDGNYTKAVTGLIGEVTVDAFSSALVYRVPRAGNYATDEEYELSEVAKNAFVFNFKYALPSATIFAGIAPKTTADDTNQTALWLAADVMAIENLSLALQVDMAMNQDADDNATTTLGLNAGYDVQDLVTATLKVTNTMSAIGYSSALTGWAALPVKANIAEIELIFAEQMVPVVDMTFGYKMTLINFEDSDVDPVSDIKLRVAKSIGNVTNRVDLKYQLNSNSKVNEFALAYAVNIWF